MESVSDRNESSMIHIASKLSSEEKTLIKESSEVAFNTLHLENKGSDFLISFFRRHPEHIQHFKAFRGTPVGELNSLPFTHNHGRSVIKTIYSIVTSLENNDLLKKEIHKLLYQHLPRGISVTDMKSILDVFVRFLKEQLGPEFTHRHEEAWKSLMIYVQIALQQVEDTLSHTETLASTSLTLQ